MIVGLKGLPDQRDVLGHRLVQLESAYGVQASHDVAAFVSANDVVTLQPGSSIMTDVTCDVTSKDNARAISDRTATWPGLFALPHDRFKPRDLIAVENRLSPSPRESSLQLSEMLRAHPYTLGDPSNVWRRRCQDVKFIRPATFCQKPKEGVICNA